MNASVSRFPGAPRLVLGSTSPYRQDLLKRLGLPFDVRAPGVDEAALLGERPEALACRLAQAKAQAVATACPQEDVVVIGSDQVADLEGRALGKPGDHAGATEQLRAMRGRTVRFHTAVSVCRAANGFSETVLETVEVDFRPLSDQEIEAYLQREQPYDCAGSAKVEALGITLLSRVNSNDPTALIGLPLIAVCRLLRAAGLDPLSRA